MLTFNPRWEDLRILADSRCVNNNLERAQVTQGGTALPTAQLPTVPRERGHSAAGLIGRSRQIQRQPNQHGTLSRLLIYWRLNLLQADSVVTDPALAAEIKKKRTFRTFSYRGVALEQLLDLSNEDVRALP